MEIVTLIIQWTLRTMDTLKFGIIIIGYALVRVFWLIQINSGTHVANVLAFNNFILGCYHNAFSYIYLEA